MGMEVSVLSLQFPFCVLNTILSLVNVAYECRHLGGESRQRTSLGFLILDATICLSKLP
jgi:hypothetical protein